ncbi:SDR family oxidoreductase [Rufibacter glacialis]|uniref:SDR family oxidoreductase n=1 Tax=Rufibacter glacialis TaxID=1259555 RepID=A0A5M8QB11_9BACT|nr:SDR family oxidoreductase [Rufibacter glacialis]KAA6431712.1 SDR family oxidoreductase [Rufibacter glacialis]GGK82225.1 SDR family oxidoreductase [Rufibacter glacialis]
MELEGKVVVITGASSGIGLAAAKLLLEKGATVVSWSRTRPKISHQDFYFFECDVRHEHSVLTAYEQTVERLRQNISVLINNAGLGIQGALDTMSPKDWHKMMDTNVNGVFYCTRLVLPQMKKQLEGHIINISSIAGLNGVENMSGYCATKFAVRGISHSLFKEVRPFGIKVTCIYPGSTATQFFDGFEGTGTAPENMMQPEDIASTILHVLQSPPNYHHVDIEVRPLMPKGRPEKKKA